MFVRKATSTRAIKNRENLNTLPPEYVTEERNPWRCQQEVNAPHPGNDRAQNRGREKREMGLNSKVSKEGRNRNKSEIGGCAEGNV